MKKSLKILVAAVFLVAVTAAFFGVPYVGAACHVQPAVSWTFLVVLALTPLVGRFFCETMCPLGILQTLVNRLFHPRRHVRRVCTRLPVAKAQTLVRGTVLVVFAALVGCGCGGLAGLLSPYAIYGRALTVFTAGSQVAALAGLVLLVTILVLAVFGQGRLWCNWVCPAGTLFTLLAKRSVCAHKVGPGCANCRKCFGKKGSGPLGDRPPPPGDRPAPEEGLTRREALQGVAVLAAVETVEKTTDGGYARVSLPGVPARAARVLPPGALSQAAFDRLCIGCGRCLSACPAHVLVASAALRTFGQPEMDFRRGSCLVGCDFKCAAACPVEALALRRLKTEARLLPHRDVHVGFAAWRKDLCIRTTDGVPCTACVRKCPVQAIHLVEGFPVVDVNACIGCGACEHVCPARPMPAMQVSGLEVQRVVRPMAG